MILDDAKTHMDQMVVLLKKCQEIQPNLTNKDYLTKLEDFVQRFKHWYPEAYAYIEGGCLQGVSANCNLAFNLWDNDNEKENQFDEDKNTYDFRHDEWNQMIDAGHKDGTLKPIL